VLLIIVVEVCVFTSVNILWKFSKAPECSHHGKQFSFHVIVVIVTVMSRQFAVSSLNIAVG